MTHPIEKTKRAPLIHHPTAVLDSFCRYGEHDQAWQDFSASLTQQLAQFEAAHSDYIRPRAVNNRRSSNR